MTERGADSQRPLMSRRNSERRNASLFLGKDKERWAKFLCEALGTPCNFVRSAYTLLPAEQPNDKMGSHKYASALGLPVGGSGFDSDAFRTKRADSYDSMLKAKPESQNSWTLRSSPRRRPDPRTGASPLTLISPGAFSPPLRSPLVVSATSSKLDASSPAKLEEALTAALAEQAHVGAPPVVASEILEEEEDVKTPQASTVHLPGMQQRQTMLEPTVQTRRYRRSHLLRSAQKDRVPTPRSGSPEPLSMSSMGPPIPLYGNLDILPLRPRRTIEDVEGTLYDEEGPFREGETSDSLSVRLFYAPGQNGKAGMSYLITTPDNRVFSAAKRRRWAMDEHGHFFAAMEIKSVESKLRSAYNEMVDPVYAREYENDLRKHYEDDILDELQKAESLTPGQSLVTPHVLRTEDGKIVRLEEDFPEEAFFAIAGCNDDELYPVVLRVFVDAIRLLWRMHSHGWMHGDIKLENLMFNGNAELYIIDFENASPFRGSRQHDGMIQLLSYDWTPPELEVSRLGRRMGPSGDLWALGANLIRAFALRDGVTDGAVREMLMGEGMDAFFAFRRTLLQTTETEPDDPPVAYGVNLGPLLRAANVEEKSIHANPARVLRLFAQRGPRLLQYILAHSVTPSPTERDEQRGVELADELLHDPENESLWQTVSKALATSIELSGSSWVRPKLDEARHILQLGQDDPHE
ncbi:hypothetical protein MEQU1_002708 [Malassezia equina]|uniref:Protein kinase domain-containing protein n=1 Tax=Malassezia equina TaxID=1381935 RepID=A0AAF0EG85_9BASI|nr:hypothetical protein MEQU1_002708 [Malassezia equina]